LGEVLVAFFVFSLVISGLIFGYSQVNRMAEFSAMSMAAQTSAEEGMEQAKSAQWDYVRWPNTNFGPGTGDDLGFLVGSNYTTNISDTMDVPTTGAAHSHRGLRHDHLCADELESHPSAPAAIRSDVVWTCPLDGVSYTNTAITLRAPDQ